MSTSVELMEPLVGRRVRLVGLSSREDLNNRVGKCMQYRAERQRYVVELVSDNSTKQHVSVPLSSVEAEEEPPSLFSRFDLRDRTLYFGRSALQTDLVSIFMERCRVEIEAKDDRQPRYRLAGCAVCGQRSPSMITCGGCGLCQWCDDRCQRHGVEAGHGVLCRQFRSLRAIFSESAEIREASRLFHSAEQQQGDTRAGREATRLARVNGLDRAQAGTLEFMCQNAVQWPASAEIATGPPGTKVRLNEVQIVEMDMSFDQGSAKFVPGKLTLCATSHRQRYKSLSKTELSTKHMLPCGQNPFAGHSKGIHGDLSHPPVQASLKDLSKRKLQQTLCTAGCNNHTSPVGGDKAIISDMFYSYCLNRVCNANGLPGSIQHCPVCGLCRNYMYKHCSRCNMCSFGSHFNVMPCMTCHDLVLLHDGIAFVPVASGQCSSDQVVGIAAMLECKCGNGNILWNDPKPSTRKALVASQSLGLNDFKTFGISDAESSAISRSFAEKRWTEAQSDPVVRVELIDKVLNILRKLQDSDSSAIDAAAGMVEGGQEFFDATMKVTELFVQKFEAERQNAADGVEAGASLEAWLVAQRLKAVAAVESELAARQASGVPADKQRYKAVLAKKCDFCGTGATPTKALKSCSGCKAVSYCDSECQKQAWTKHRVACKRSQRTAAEKNDT